MKNLFLKNKKILSLFMAFALAFSFSAHAEPASLSVKVPILLYHNITFDENLHGNPILNITEEQFRIHMLALKEAGFNPITFSDYYEFVSNGKSLPQKPIIISFDDGYTSNFTLAFPILKELNMKATIFVVTERMGAKAGDAGIVVFPHFTWEDAREMESSGIIEIESHSDTHGNMLAMPVADMQRELRRSKYLIEKNLNKECNVFAFPYGGNTTYARTLGAAAGYKIQCLVGDVGSNSAGSDLTALKRITVFGNQTSEQLIQKITENLI